MRPHFPSAPSGVRRAILLALVAVPLAPSAKAPSPVRPLPPPAGTIVRVSTERQLQAAVQQLRSGTTILIAPGTYRLSRTLHIGNGRVEDVALRGASDNRDDVVIEGPGMTNSGYGEVPNGVWMGSGAQRVLVANLRADLSTSEPTRRSVRRTGSQ
jgi:hypothetical protein